MLNACPTTAATKIVATLGPAWHDTARMHEMLRAGVDVARINFSHGRAVEHIAHAQQLRQVAKVSHCNLAILADLQGAKIRIGEVHGGSVELHNGQTLLLDTAYEGLGTSERVGVDYAGLTADVQTGDVLLLNDGLLQLQVRAVQGSQVVTTVLEGGTLASRKGVNKRGGGLSLNALTDKDDADIASALRLGADYIAVSFVKDAADVHQAREMVEQHARQQGLSGADLPALIAKIERTEAIDNLTGIIAASEGIMVARGDLAVETGFAAVPALQKQMIAQARAMGRLTITATQMMESMVHNAAPTRAEVSDVANAVLDGTDAVMLSAETAVGEHAVEVVRQMDSICLAAEWANTADVAGSRGAALSTHHVCGVRPVVPLPMSPLGMEQAAVDGSVRRVDETIVLGTAVMAEQLHAKAIVTLTDSGSTSLYMSRLRMATTWHVPIIALTEKESTLRKMALFNNVQGVLVDLSLDIGTALQKTDALLKKHAGLRSGDVYLLTYGQPMGQAGGTNTVKVCRVA